MKRHIQLANVLSLNGALLISGIAYAEGTGAGGTGTGTGATTDAGTGATDTAAGSGTDMDAAAGTDTGTTGTNTGGEPLWLMPGGLAMICGLVSGCVENLLIVSCRDSGKQVKGLVVAASTPTTF